MCKDKELEKMEDGSNREDLEMAYLTLEEFGIKMVEMKGVTINKIIDALGGDFRIHSVDDVDNVCASIKLLRGIHSRDIESRMSILQRKLEEQELETAAQQENFHIQRSKVETLENGSRALNSEITALKESIKIKDRANKQKKEKLEIEAKEYKTRYKNVLVEIASYERIMIEANEIIEGYCAGEAFESFTERLQRLVDLKYNPDPPMYSLQDIETALEEHTERRLMELEELEELEDPEYPKYLELREKFE